MHVFPLIVSKMQLGYFDSIAREDLGRSITKGGDNARLDTDSYPAYLAALASFTDEASVAVRACSDYEMILRHLHFAYYISGDGLKSTSVCLGTHLSVDVGSDGKTMIVSGSLYSWKHAIIFYCKNDYPKQVREIFNAIFNYFKQAKLREVWRDFQTQELQDGTFQLTYRS